MGLHRRTGGPDSPTRLAPLGARALVGRRILTVVEIVVVVLVSTAGAAVQGSLGIGLAMVAGPALITIDSGFAPGPLLMVAQLIGVRHLVAERQHFDRDTYRRCLYGMPVGIAGGLVVLALVSERVLAIIIGSLVAISATALLAGVRIRRSPANDVGAGAAASLASVTAGLPGAPVAIAFSEMAPATMRGTTSAFVMTQSVVAFGALLLTDNFGRHEVALSAWLLPGVVLGLFAARFVRRFLDRSWFRTAVLAIAMAGGLALVARQLI